MHLLTYHIYLSIVSLEETFAYSGYNVLPGAFILGGIARRQELHLMNKGKGNYGCLGIMDPIMGTNVEEETADSIRDEVEDRNVVEKVKEKRKGTGRKGRGKGTI